MSDQKSLVLAPDGFELVPRSLEYAIPEDRLLEVTVAQEIFGCTIHVIEMQDFSRTDKYVTKRFIFAVPPYQTLDLSTKDQLLKEYAHSLHDAQLVIEKIVREMSQRQTYVTLTEEHAANLPMIRGQKPQGGDNAQGYGAAMNLQFVRLEHAAVENWQADFFEVGKLGPIEATKTVGVGKVPAEAICRSALTAHRAKTKNDRFQRDKVKEWKMVRAQQIEAGPSQDIIDVPKALPKVDKGDE